MKPIIHERIAAGPAIDDASQAPKSQPEPINEPSPSNISYGKLILPLCLSCDIITPISFIFMIVKALRIVNDYTMHCILCYYTLKRNIVKSTSIADELFIPLY